MDPAGSIVRFVEMDREAYRSASFLDDRLFRTPVRTSTRRLDEIDAALGADQRTDARWIFHIGHVGSTLISRILGELDGVLALREPRLLRDLAALPADRRRALMPVVQALFSRTLAAREEMALVKATSFVGEIAAEIVPAGERALFVHVAPRTYIATILAGENSREELRLMAPARLTRMARRVPNFCPSTEAEFAAAAWACEMSALEAAAATMPDRHLLWVDFDTLLHDVPAALRRIAAFMNFRASPNRIDQIARGPLMRRYSKAPEHDYSPALRRELLEQEYRLQGSQIDAALAMLGASAQNSELLARALARTSPEC